VTRTARILRIGGGGVALGLAVIAVAALRPGPSGGSTAPPVVLTAPPAALTAPAPADLPVEAPAKEGDTRYSLDTPDEQSIWATVEKAVGARKQPSATSKVVGKLTTRTPEGTTGNVLLLERAVIDGEIWLRVRLPILPNGTTGWVPRDALGSYHYVTTKLVIDRKRLKATLYDGGKAVFTAPIGIGTTAAPTPAGKFYIRNKLAGFSGAAFYGPVAFGTSARSAVLTDWPDGGYIGIHGTDTPGILPGRVSHGCIRLRNTDIERLSRLLAIGSPVTIV
jgi:lipoprotein-anchoring transpeptidase ErfK/SrfK